MDHASRVHDYAMSFPEAAHVLVEAWGNQPTYRVRNKNFMFSNPAATNLTLKLSTEEARAVVNSDARVKPAGYGLGRHGWVTIQFCDTPTKMAHPDPTLSADDWAELQEWIETSYRLVAPTTLVARLDHHRFE